MPKTDYEKARDRFHLSASEVRHEMGTDILRRLDPEGTSDTKLVELVMEAMYRVTEWPLPTGGHPLAHSRPEGTES